LNTVVQFPATGATAEHEHDCFWSQLYGQILLGQIGR